MIIISQVTPIKQVQNDKDQTEQTETQTAKEIDPEQSEFFKMLKPMLTPEALAAVLRRENK